MMIEEIRPEYRAKFESCKFHRVEQVLGGRSKRVYCYALNENCCLNNGRCAFWKPMDNEPVPKKPKRARKK